KIGHGSDREALTGTSVILCPEGMTAAAEVRGSATGTRQFDSLVSVQHLGSKARYSPPCPHPPSRVLTLPCD
ncbi:MAG TPA: hypothetical protein VLV54_14750, partial [Thermoanaerobaculia bacterium]|nr:hypothetical protein [Thermoanaerobaculia bacterium]